MFDVDRKPRASQRQTRSQAGRVQTRTRPRFSSRPTITKKTHHDSVYFFDLEQAQGLNTTVYQTRSWCIINFGNIAPECLQDLNHSQMSFCTNVHLEPRSIHEEFDCAHRQMAAEGTFSFEPRNQKETTFVIWKRRYHHRRTLKRSQHVFQEQLVTISTRCSP